MTRTRSGLKALVIFFATAAVMTIVSLAGEPVDSTAERLLAAHNRERMTEHLGPLALSAKLCESATVHARDMAKVQKLDHTGSDGSKMADRVKRVGYVSVRIGENIANGQKTVGQVMESWMKSPGHRANILANYTEMGGALAVDADGSNYWCVNFGAPMPRLKPDEAAAAVVKRINRDREPKRHEPLKIDPKLGRAAMAISAAMAAKDSFELGSDPYKLIDEKSTERREVRLQLSAGEPTAEEAARALEGESIDQLAGFDAVGIGYALAKNGTPYWCAIFAKPLPFKRSARTRSR